MKKSFITLLLSLAFSQAYACAWWDPEYEYFNLFAQTTINSPMYEPFLRIMDVAYFGSEAYENQRNENIEDWQRYFGIPYEQAHYLVFVASREEVQKLAKGNSSVDKNLDFADARFRKKFKQALLYLAYAKYLEPYMAFKRSDNTDYYWGYLPEKTVAELDYSKVIGVLTKSWNAESDPDLKLRYGYQLVRFAHYSHRYQAAIQFFNQYVESLNYKTIMYYYALDQKGGAERALGNFMQANYDFFQFFTHTKNRKTDAYTSMKITQDLDFENMLKQVKTDNEKFDLYMLLGYRSFNDPMAELKKIIAISPDAVQAKVLMAREINSLEREILPIHYYCPYNYDTGNHEKNCLSHLKDKRLPVLLDEKIQERLNSSIAVSAAQAKNTKEKDFWNLTTAYLYFLKKDYDKSSEFLDKVKATDPIYKNEKSLFGMLLEITSQQKIDADFEKQLMQKYGDFFHSQPAEQVHYEANTTQDFVMDILANRYFLQKDYAKSFLLQNFVSDLEANPDVSLLQDIQSFYYKKDKNEFEQWLKSAVDASFYVSEKMKNRVVYDFESFVANMEGTMALTEGDFRKALRFFEKVDPKFSLRGGVVAYDENWNPTFSHEVYNGFSNISEAVFGYNRMECFECPEELVMNTEFTEDFSFIKKKMNKKELAEALIQLDEISKMKGEKAAKAGYLLGNFYFNTTTLGYFRELLTFDINNSYGPKFHDNYFSPEANVFYFKGYGYNPNYQNHFELPLTYLESALSKTELPEMKARILFALSKCEQGTFYKAMHTDPALKNIEYDWNNYAAYEQKMLAVKTSKYRKYFKELKKYHSTGFYKEVTSHCKYFDYYSSHY